MVLVATSIAAGCGGFLGFGDADEAPQPNVASDAAPADATVNAEGGSTVDRDAHDAVDSAPDVSSGDAATQADGRVCVLSASCAKSVFDCCSEMEDVGAASCGGICGVDICCF